MVQSLSGSLLSVLNAELDRAAFAQPEEPQQVADLMLIIGAPCDPSLSLDRLVAASMRVALRMQESASARSEAAL